MVLLISVKPYFKTYFDSNIPVILRTNLIKTQMFCYNEKI